MPPTEHDLTVAAAIGSLKATAEATLRLVEELKTSLTTTSATLDARISKLERWRAYVLGLAAAAGLVASKVGDFIHLSLQ